LFEALCELASKFLRDGIIATWAVDEDTARELFANAGLSGEIPARDDECVEEIA
jgi:hypothetical protein